MSYAGYGYGRDEDVADGPAAYGFGVNILIPFFQKLRTFLVKITRMRTEEVQK